MALRPGTGTKPANKKPRSKRGFSFRRSPDFTYLAGAESVCAGAGLADGAGGALGCVMGEVGRVEGAEPTVDGGEAFGGSDWLLATLSSRPRKPISAKASSTTTTAPAIQPHMELDSSSMIRGGIRFGSVVRNGSLGS